jgi:protocatechuate 3,4-dioxygenase beta subunit
MHAIALAAALILAAQTQPADPPVNVVPPPPGTEPAPTARLIDEADMALGAGKGVSDILADPAYNTAREFPRFRAVIKARAAAAPVTMTMPSEPGTRLDVHARLMDQKGAPIAGALVYAYHTDAKGWYSHRGPHIGGNGGDVNHARLFAYVRSDADGRFELHTIRPAGYPRSELPQHIHIHFDAPGFRPVITEILFDDDPRLTDAMRAEAAREGAEIFKVEKEEGQAERVRCQFTLRSR